MPDNDNIATQIYMAYPRKVGRKDAIKAILKALDEIERREFFVNAGDWLLARVKVYAASRRPEDAQFTPFPATWFNQGRYDDDPTEWTRKPQTAAERIASREFPEDAPLPICNLDD